MNSPHVDCIENEIFLELPNLGLLKSDSNLETLRKEMAQSLTSRADVAISAARQVLMRTCAAQGGAIGDAEISRILLTIALA